MFSWSIIIYIRRMNTNIIHRLGQRLYSYELKCQENPIFTAKSIFKEFHITISCIINITGLPSLRIKQSPGHRIVTIQRYHLIIIITKDTSNYSFGRTINKYRHHQLYEFVGRLLIIVVLRFLDSVGLWLFDDVGFL